MTLGLLKDISCDGDIDDWDANPDAIVFPYTGSLHRPEINLECRRANGKIKDLSTFDC